jgi:hypothetical protein
MEGSGMETDQPKLCFVIMPFGQKPDQERDAEMVPFDDIYEYIIKEVVVERLGLRCIRCDEIPEPGWIHADMLELIYQADIAIVDISTLNPNVFYELGVRHTLRPTGTILMRKKGTQIPFDIRGLRVINYDLDLKSAREAKDTLEQFIRNSLQRQAQDSIVYDVFPRLNVSLE